MAAVRVTLHTRAPMTFWMPWWTCGKGLPSWQSSANSFPCSRTFLNPFFFFLLSEYDVPYHMRASIDRRIFVGKWYNVQVGANGVDIRGKDHFNQFCYEPGLPAAYIER